MDDYDDDYVAKLLAEDAKKTSSKYASQGLSAFLPQRRAADAPKPNTRFLTHLVRDVDSHNAALKRKEELEAERRLRALREADEEPPRKRRRADESDKAKGRRMFQDILGAARSDKACRLDKHLRLPDSRHAPESASRKHRSKEHKRRSRSPSRDRSRRHRRDRDNSIEPNARLCTKRRSNQGSKGIHEVEQSSHIRPLEDLQDDSVPSDDGRLANSDKEVVAPVRIRGRGAHKSRNGMNDRFAKDYDPSQDVSLDSDHDNEGEDWDLALEAMRDRIKYKQNQVARMRQAGFDDKQIAKWEKGVLNGDHDGDPKDVKWSRQGEVRAWDAGKAEQ